MMRRERTNKLNMIGEITEKAKLSYRVGDRNFYEVGLSIPRISGIIDQIPVVVTEDQVDPAACEVGKVMVISGEYHSYNKHCENEKTRTILYVRPDTVEVVPVTEEIMAENMIQLDGYICKAPIYRKTPKGRDIADITLAVNRPDGKSDYLPCILWGADAILAQNMPVGTHLLLDGRIQSRQYMKQLETKTELRTAYEVSASRIRVADPSTKSKAEAFAS